MPRALLRRRASSLILRRFGSDRRRNEQTTRASRAKDTISTTSGTSSRAHWTEWRGAPMWSTFPKLYLCGTFSLTKKIVRRAAASLLQGMYDDDLFPAKAARRGWHPDFAHSIRARLFANFNQIFAFCTTLPSKLSIILPIFENSFHPHASAWFVRLTNRFFRKSHVLPGARDPVSFPTHAGPPAVRILQRAGCAQR